MKHASSLVCIDASVAIEACEETLRGSENVEFYLSTIHDFQILEQKFDIVFCVGVLQHTKDYKSDLSNLTKMLNNGGRLYVDFYRKKWKNLWPPIGGFGNVFRFIVKRLDPLRSFAITEKTVNFYFPIHWKFRDSRVIQQFLFRISPVRFYYPWLGLKDRHSYFEWALLDTYDGSTDRYKHRTSVRKFQRLLERLPLHDIEVWKGGNGVEARAKIVG